MMSETFKTIFKHSLRMYMLTTALILASSSGGQTSMPNVPFDSLITTQIEMLQVDFLEAGDAGDNMVWEYTTLNPIREYPIESVSNSDSVYITEITPEYINKYVSREDSLLLLSTESPLEKIEFKQPIRLFAYPFTYMDSYEGAYSGTGKYCQTHQIDKEGFINVEVDGRGTLILEGDTLENVIRIHSTRTGSICMHSNDEDSLYDDVDRMKQEIEDKYQWFAEDCRFPVFETGTTSYYDDMELVSCIQRSLRYVYDKLSPEEIEEDVLEQEDSLLEIHTDKPQVIQYTISTAGSQVNLSYSLAADANITILVCNHMGMTYRYESFRKPAGDGYVKTIDCSGLRSGTYILYLNVNGTVYSEKVKI